MRSAFTVDATTGSELKTGVSAEIIHAPPGWMPMLLGELRDMELPSLFFGDGYAALITEDELEVQQIVILKLVETT